MTIPYPGTAGGGHSNDWVKPKKHPHLKAQDVHVWKIGLRASKAELGRMKQLLGDDELQRADRFRFERHRRRFIVGRAAMRALLGRYMDVTPEALDFSFNAHGKPALQGARTPDFNFTNAHEMALMCVSMQRAVGIDLEHLTRDADHAGIVNRYFARDEARELSQLPQEQRHAAFLAGWTRKEAYIKAVGTGLSMPLSSFQVSIDPDKPPQLLQVDGQPGEARRWRLVSLSPDPAYVATLAAEGQEWALRCFQWPD